MSDKAVEQLAAQIQTLTIERQFTLAAMAAERGQWDLAELVGQVALDRVIGKRLFPKLDKAAEKRATPSARAGR